MPGSEKLEVNAFAFCFRAIDVSNVPQRMTLGRLCWTAVLTKLTRPSICVQLHSAPACFSGNPVRTSLVLSLLGAFNWGNRSTYQVTKKRESQDIKIIKQYLKHSAFVFLLTSLPMMGQFLQGGWIEDCTFSALLRGHVWTQTHQQEFSM